ncbi:MAG: helix-turn-helix domain-containing protein [Solirubrobacterales bacterium]
MTKEELERYLAEGLSLEQIGRRVGRHPSTVRYHMQKHGLKPLGHDRHAPNGKVDPDRLRALIKRGASIHGAAEELGVSYTTVCHWVRRLGLETERMARLKKTRGDEGGNQSGPFGLSEAWGDLVFQESERSLPVQEMPCGGGFAVSATRQGALDRACRRVLPDLRLRQAPGRASLPPSRSCREIVPAEPQRRHSIVRRGRGRGGQVRPPMRELPRGGRSWGRGAFDGPAPATVGFEVQIRG